MPFLGRALGGPFFFCDFSFAKISEAFYVYRAR